MRPPLRRCEVGAWVWERALGRGESERARETSTSGEELLCCVDPIRSFSFGGPFTSFVFWILALGGGFVWSGSLIV